MIENTSLSSLTSKLPKYPTRRGTITCADSRKEKSMESIVQAVQGMGDVSTIDGIRVDMDDGWILIRPSGTEPKIRITAEARNNVDSLFRTAEKIVVEAVK